MTVGPAGPSLLHGGPPEQHLGPLSEAEAVVSEGEGGWQEQMFAKLSSISAVQRSAVARMDQQNADIKAQLTSVQNELGRINILLNATPSRSDASKPTYQGFASRRGARIPSHSSVSDISELNSLSNRSLIQITAGEPERVFVANAASTPQPESASAAGLLRQSSFGSERGARSSPPSRSTSAHNLQNSGINALKELRKARAENGRHEARMMSDSSELDRADPSGIGFVAPALPLGWPAALGLREGFLEQEELGSGTASVQLEATTKALKTKTKKPGWESLPQMKTSWLQACVMDPNSARRVVLDYVSLLVLLYDVLMVPYLLAWDVPLVGALRVISFFNASHWTLDMCLSFFTGFYRDGEVEMTLREVVRHYRRTWFLPELFMVICDWASLLLETLTIGSVKLVKFAKLPRFIRVAAMLRMLRLPRLFDTFAYQTMSDWRRCVLWMLASITGVLVIVHYMCCAWRALGRWGPSDTGYSWTDVTIMMGDQDIPYLHLEDSLQYLVIFHWFMSMMTVGNEMVYTFNSAERVFNILGLNISLVVSATLISSISSVMVNFQLARAEQNLQMRLLNRYMAEAGVHKRVAVRVRRQIAQRMTQVQEVNTDKDVPALKHLTPLMLADLRYEICTPHLQKHPLFRLWITIDTYATKQFCVEGLDFLCMRAEDDLFVAGADAEGAYYLISGSMQYIQDPESSPVEEEEAVEAPKGRWMSEAALWSYWIHVGTARATQVSRVMFAHPEGMMKAMSRCRPLRLVSQQWCQGFHQKVMSASPSSGAHPTDLAVPHTSSSELIMSMGQEARLMISRDVLEHLESERKWYHKAGNRNRVLSQDQIDRLRKEAFAGLCTLHLNAQGEAERIVHIIVLRVTDPEGRVLTEIGKAEEHRPRQAGCKAPAVKAEMDEDAEIALQRMLSTKLRLLQGVAMLRREYECQVDFQDSLEFSVPTQYIKTVCSTNIADARSLRAPRCMADESCLSRQTSNSSDAVAARQLKSPNRQPSRELGHPGSNAMNQDVLVCVDKKKYYLYAWLTPDEIEYFRNSPAGRKEVRNWVNALDIDSAVASFNLEANGQAPEAIPEEQRDSVIATPSEHFLDPVMPSVAMPVAISAGVSAATTVPRSV